MTIIDASIFFTLQFLSKYEPVFIATLYTTVEREKANFAALLIEKTGADYFKEYDDMEYQFKQAELKYKNLSNNLRQISYNLSEIQ